MSDSGFIANDSLTELDHDDWTDRDLTNHEVIINRLDKIEKDIAEFKELAGKIWTFVEQMKTNPMLAAMLGGLPK